MTDTVIGSLLNGRAPRTSLCDLPAEMLQNIFSYLYSDLVSLMRLSATCSVLRKQVHEIFTSRIEAQANKYPEVKQSLDRLGWKKAHHSWDCKCFQMIAGPTLSWSQLEERSVCAIGEYALFENSTTAAGKTFFAATSGKVTYTEMAPDGGHMSLRTLTTFNHVYSIRLASHDNVLAVFLNKMFPRFTVSLCIFDASTLAKVTEMKLCDDDDFGLITFGRNIALTRDTMIVLIDDLPLQWGAESKIQIWKLNTQNPQEEGIALLHTMTHQTAPLSRFLPSYPQSFCINDRYTVIFDMEVKLVKVFGRNEELPLVCQIELANKTVKAMAMQGGQADHLALALMSLNADGVPELTVKVYSASQGHLIIQKEIRPFQRRSANLFMKWLGEHLTVALQQDNVISMFSWQPGLESFFSSPSGVPVVRRSLRGNGGDMWTAKCLQVDFQGITTAVYSKQSKKVFLKTWKSAS